MTALIGLTDAELSAANTAVNNSRPLSPLLGAALIREVMRLRRAASQDHKVIASLSTESLRLGAALQRLRADIDTALNPDVSPAPGNRTVPR